MNDSRRGSQRPTLLHEPPDAVDWSVSDLAVEYAAEVGYVLDEWQQFLVRWSFARRPDGLWAARDFGIEVPRQNGKNIVLEVIEVVALFALGEDLVIHSAHRTDVSHEHFLSLKAHIESQPDLVALMPNTPNGGFMTANGKESITLDNGNRLLFKSRQSGSGRGPRPKRLVFDEALILSTTAVGDMAPGMTAQRNPQIIFASSPPKADSTMLHDLRRRAHEAEDGDRLFYAGWNNPNDADPNNPDSWYAVNPSLGYGRMTEDSLNANRRLMTFEDYVREHIGIPEEPVDAQSVIDSTRWDDLADADSREAAGTVRLALDAPPDRRTATFATAGKRDDNVMHVQVRYHVPPAQMKDLVSLARELCGGHGVDLLIPAGSPALAWKADLEAAGVTVDVIPPAECSAAFGYLLSHINEGTIRHRNQPELNNAVAGLTVKTSGDVDVPARRTSSTNIAPFIAAMCALYRVPISEPPRPVFAA